MSTPTPTPRTGEIAHFGFNESTYIARMTELARTLERELAEVKTAIESALLINRTIEIGSMSRVESSHPIGWMPPGKRQQIIKILESFL